MSITRRQFIRRTGLTAAGTLLGPGIFGHPLVRSAFAATSNRYFIVLFLEGGNDGLNTISPIDNGLGSLRSDYDIARGTGGGGLRLLPSELLTLQVPGIVGKDPNTQATLGMHPGFEGRSDDITQSGDPGFGGLYQLYKDGMVAVMQGCGYPGYNLSHDESSTIWQTGNPLYNPTLAGTGWVGRHLAGAFGGSAIPAYCPQDSIPLEFRQYTTSVLSVRRLENFSFPHDDAYSSDTAAKDVAFAALHGLASAGGQPMKLVGDAGTATFNASVSYPVAHDVYRSDRDPWYDGYTQINRSLSRDFREIAKVIYAQEKSSPLGGIGARYFQLSNGGYDTHSDQQAADPDGQHYSLHSEVGASLKHFFDDLASMDAGLPDRTTVLVWSEFSRRIEQNDNGTDHGSQGPMLIIGGKVNGGIYGRHPNIAESDWDDDGNTVYRQGAHAFRSTDFRDVYGTVLKNWLGMSNAGILSILPTDSGAASDFWTVANFDLKRGADNADLFQP